MTARRSELDLFRALGHDGNAADLAEFSGRLRKCVYWLLNQKTWGWSLRAEAEEIVDDVLVRFEQLRQRGFEGNAGQFRSYLYKVVGSVCAEARDRRARIASLDAPVTLPNGDEKPLGEIVEGMVDPALGADTELERTEEGNFARHALERLDARCRTLLHRFHIDSVPIKELAREQGARVNTIEVALTRCRTRLYAAFLSLYVDASDATWRGRITRTAERLSNHLRRVFLPWWRENRTVADISKELGMPPLETKRLLGEAKFQVWRLLAEEAS